MAAMQDFIPVGPPAPGPWAQDALCSEVDPDLFFPEKGDSPKTAKRVCRQCDVLESCLEWALTNRVRHGVLGGMSDQERLRITRAEDRRAQEAALLQLVDTPLVAEAA